MTLPAGSEKTVLARRAGRVGHVVLNRPQALNAVTVELAQALEQALVELADEVGVIVVRGAGGNFSVGGDFNELERLRARGDDAMRELFESFGRACRVIRGLPVPVIAAVEGYALAGGFELMQACDFALVRDDARIGDNHSNFGQVPGGGGSQRLPRLIGRQRALALMLTGDHLSGTEAAAWGLAYRALPDHEFDPVVEDLAERIADKSPEALARIKALVHGALEQPLDEGLAHEIDVVLEHLHGSAAGAGIETFSARETEGAT
jgi:enoyl-CoA hydratase/carnithine racemase